MERWSKDIEKLVYVYTNPVAGIYWRLFNPKPTAEHFRNADICADNNIVLHCHGDKSMLWISNESKSIFHWFPSNAIKTVRTDFSEDSKVTTYVYQYNNDPLVEAFFPALWPDRLLAAFFSLHSTFHPTVVWHNKSTLQQT